MQPEAVGAHDFIMKLSGGYDAEVHERGATLSVGQRQLLSFARALIADPRIIILDEATSSVDTETEIVIQAALRRLLAGRTSFIIAHRLSTIREEAALSSWTRAGSSRSVPTTNCSIVAASTTTSTRCSSAPRQPQPRTDAEHNKAEAPDSGPWSRFGHNHRRVNRTEKGLERCQHLSLTTA